MATLPARTVPDAAVPRIQAAFGATFRKLEGDTAGEHVTRCIDDFIRRTVQGHERGLARAEAEAQPIADVVIA